MNLDPDIIIYARFLTSAEGGRKTDVFGDFYSCPIIIKGDAFESRVLLGGEIIKLGCWYKLKVKFLNLALVAPSLAMSEDVQLLEGKVVATGHIIEIKDRARQRPD